MILILDILFRFRVTEDLSVVEKHGCADMHLRSRYFFGFIIVFSPFEPC
jgi:hypothetical protein